LTGLNEVPVSVHPKKSPKIDETNIQQKGDDSIFFPRSNICQLSRTTSIFGMKILNYVKIWYAEILISGETPQIHQKNRGFFGFHGNFFWETAGFSTISSLQVLKLQRNKGFI